MEKQDHDHHGLNLSLTLKCPNHKNNHNVNPPPPPPPPPPPVLHAPPPSKFLSSLLPCPYKFIPSPYNFLPPDHQIRRPPNFKPPSYAEMDKEISEYIEEKRREAAAQERERERQKRELEEELGMVSSPHSTVSTTSLSGNKRGEREENYEADRDLSSNYVIVISEDEDGGDAAAAAARKKLRLSKDQAALLEETFKEQMTLSTKQKLALAKQLDLRPRQVEVWFQNRRARTKLKQTEVDCGYLKRCCETLSAENKRLQKELAELRALKLSSQSYMNMYPPTTLTMCPQCERITAASSSSSSAQTSSVAGVSNTNHQKPTSGIPFNKLISSEALDVRRPQP